MVPELYLADKFKILGDFFPAPKQCDVSALATIRTFLEPETRTGGNTDILLGIRHHKLSGRGPNWKINLESGLGDHQIYGPFFNRL